jgi:hypothetical protein
MRALTLVVLGLWVVSVGGGAGCTALRQAQEPDLGGVDQLGEPDVPLDGGAGDAARDADGAHRGDGADAGDGSVGDAFHDFGDGPPVDLGGDVSPDATPPQLISLTIDPGALMTVFDPSVTSYTATVPLLQDVTTLTATPEAGAQVYLGNTSSDVFLVSLGLTSNVESLMVTAPPRPANLYQVAITRDPTQLGQSTTGFLKAINVSAGDGFGGAVAVDGPRGQLVVGSIGESSPRCNPGCSLNTDSVTNSGAAYLFERQSGAWVYQDFLKAGNADSGDLFGSSVAVSGGYVAVGAPAEKGSTQQINGPDDNNASFAGAVYVYSRDPQSGHFTQEAYIKAPNTLASQSFGTSVSLLRIGSTTRLAVGAPGESSSQGGVSTSAGSGAGLADSGAVYTFVRQSDGWHFEYFIKATDPQGNSGFGQSVSQAPGYLVVGAPFSGLAQNGSGLAYVFTLGTTFNQIAILQAQFPDEGDRFGTSVSVDGSGLIAVGAPREASASRGVDSSASNNGATASGAAFVFGSDGAGGWEQQAYLKSSNSDPGDQFGTCVATHGGLVMVGAPGEASMVSGVNAGSSTDNSDPGAGAVYMFQAESGGRWAETAFIKAANTAAGAAFGISVALDTGVMVVGAQSESTTQPQSGAAYVFE